MVSRPALRHPTVAAVADLVALRRHQLAVVADSLDAALALEEAVQQQAVTVVFSTVEEFLRSAPDEQSRALWSAWLDRATTPIPTDTKEVQ